MFDWLRKAWSESTLAMRALEELQADNTLTRLAAGEIRISEKKINELMASTKMEGVREVSLTTGDGFFTISARSERFFLARVTVPMKIEQVIFTPYRHRLLLGLAGEVGAHGTSLWQKAAAYVLVTLLRYVLHESAALEEASDPTAGVTFNGKHLEIDLHRIPEARDLLRMRYDLFGEAFHPVRFVTIDAIDVHPGYFLVRSGVHWDALGAALRETFDR